MPTVECQTSTPLRKREGSRKELRRGISTAHPTFVTCALLAGLTADPGQVPFHSVPSAAPRPQLGPAYLVVTTSCRPASLSLPLGVNLKGQVPVPCSHSCILWLYICKARRKGISPFESGLFFRWKGISIS